MWNGGWVEHNDSHARPELTCTTVPESSAIWKHLNAWTARTLQCYVSAQCWSLLYISRDSLHIWYDFSGHQNRLFCIYKSFCTLRSLLPRYCQFRPNVCACSIYKHSTSHSCAVNLCLFTILHERFCSADFDSKWQHTMFHHSLSNTV